MTLLTQEEWTALRRFYAGEPARNIRQDFPDIWGLVAQVRNHPEATALIETIMDEVKMFKERDAFLRANPEPQVYGSQWAHSRRQADREKKVT